LAKHPEANSAWAGDKLVQFGNVDISVAVSIEGGLITPILQNADQKNVVQISMEMKQLASRARAGELKPEEYTGGSFSISNLGMYGVKTFSAIINPPQAAILACGAAEERALVENGNISSAQMMDMTMSVDHRVIDGALGAELLATTKFYLENPAAMLL
jgi:pyruvate dehydrogenase E2 component (dihydrolipoamide acetyltransferase)